MTLLLVGALASIAAPGCGSGSGDSGSLTKAAFVKQAEATCHEAKEKEIHAYSTYIGKSQKQELTGQAQAKFVVGGVFQPIEVMIEELHRLGGPDRQEGQIARIIKAFEDVFQSGRQDPVKALNSAAPYRKPDNLAKAYGLKLCSEF